MSTRRPRYRYVAFRLDGPRAFRREEVLFALRSMTPSLWLVGFEGTMGLVRTTNRDKDAAIHALNAVETMAGVRVRIETVGTSGTIRAATDKYLKTSDRTRRGSRKVP